MKKRIVQAIICIVVCISFIISAPSVIAASAVSDAMNGIAGYIGARDGSDLAEDHLADKVGTSAEWYVFALVHSDPAPDFASYRAALLRYLDENKVAGASTRLKFALSLIATGDRDDPYVEQTLGDSVGEQGIMSLVFGLHVYNNLKSESDADALISDISALRKDDGGWSITGNYSDVDVTAMTLQALAPYYGKNDRVTEAVDECIQLLSGRQLENGGFSSYGAENCESCAQVIIALCSLGIDPDADPRFVKNGNSALDGLLSYRREDGSFSHISGGESSELATAESYDALTAVRLLEKGRLLYVFPEIATVVPAEPEDPGDPGDPENSEEHDAAGATAKTDGDKAPVTEPRSDNNTENVKNDGNDAGKEVRKISYKLPLCLSIAGAAAVVFIILILLKKKNIKNYIFTAAVALALIAAVLLTNITAESEYYGKKAEKENVSGRVTMSIECSSLIGLAEKGAIPDGGVILELTEFEIAEGETAYDILVEAARENGILLDMKGSGKMVYISAIASVYEYEYGELAGWIYRVNGEMPSVGCAAYDLSDGDVIEWSYSLQMGSDLE